MVKVKSVNAFEPIELNMSLKTLGYTDDGKILLSTSNGRLMYLTNINIEKANKELIKNGMNPMQRVVEERGSLEECGNSEKEESEDKE